MAADFPDWTTMINILSQSVAVLHGAQYGAIKGSPVYVSGTANAADNVNSVPAQYTVPANVTFYIYGFAYGWNGQTAPKFISGVLFDSTASQTLCGWDETQGGALAFDEPLIVPTGHTVQALTSHVGDGATVRTDRATFWGVIQ